VSVDDEVLFLFITYPDLSTDIDHLDSALYYKEYGTGRHKKVEFQL